MIKELISDIDGTIYEYESNKKIVIERLWGYWRDHLSLSREVGSNMTAYIRYKKMESTDG